MELLFLALLYRTFNCTLDFLPGTVGLFRYKRHTGKDHFPLNCFSEINFRSVLSAVIVVLINIPGLSASGLLLHFPLHKHNQSANKTLQCD